LLGRDLDASAGRLFLVLGGVSELRFSEAGERLLRLRAGLSSGLSETSQLSDPWVGGASGRAGRLRDDDRSGDSDRPVLTLPLRFEGRRRGSSS